MPVMDMPPAPMDTHNPDYAEVITLPKRMARRFKKVDAGNKSDMVGVEIRHKAINEAAETLGAQSGLAHRYGITNKILESIGVRLDQLYDFRAVLIKERVLPPVYTETHAGWTKKNRTVATYNAITYEKISPASIVSRPPNWRDYLIKQFTVKLEIPPALIPENRAEQSVWEEGVAAGWEAGVIHADHIFGLSLSRLERDIVGSVRYHVLAQQGLINTVIVKDSPGFIVEQGDVLSIDQKITRVTRDANYQEIDKWKPLVIMPLPESR